MKLFSALAIPILLTTRLSSTVFILVLGFLLLASPARAATYYVSNSGNDSNSGTETAPYKTFSKAVSSLQPGDELKIAGGTYNQRLYLNLNGTANQPISISPLNGQKVTIDLNGQADALVEVPGSYINLQGLEVTGSSHTCVALVGHHTEARDFIVHDCQGHGTYADGQYILIDNHTVYDTNLENSARNWDSGWGSAFKIRIGGDNITVQNSRAYHNYGEGVAATRGSNITIKDNVFYDNFSVNLYVDNSYNVTVERNFVTCNPNSGYERDGHAPTGIVMAEENYSGWGAKLANITIKNNLIGYCYKSIVYFGSDVSGGGLDTITVAHNTLWGSQDTALSIAYESSKTKNTVIANNIIQQPQGAIAWIENRTGIDMHHNFWVGNPPQAWTNASGTGDKSGDAGLASTPNRTDPNSYRPSSSSSTINSGQTLSGITTDFTGSARDSSPDMGAFEFGSSTPPSPSPNPSPTPCPSDLNSDGITDLSDYNILVSQFFHTGSNLSADLNEDGIVDLSDYSILVSNFLDSCPS